MKPSNSNPTKKSPCSARFLTAPVVTSIFTSIVTLAVTLVVTFMILGSSSEANAAAEGEKALWVGGAGGVLVPNRSSSTARGAFGVTLGAKVGTEMGVGAYYFSSKKDEGGTQGKFDMDLYGVQGSYHFEGEAKGAFFGLRLGIAKMDFGVPTAQVSASPFHFGVFAGYDHFITNSFSVGGDVSFYSVSKGEATSLAGTTVSVDAFSALSFLATLKLWL